MSLNYVQEHIVVQHDRAEAKVKQCIQPLRI